MTFLCTCVLDKLEIISSFEALNIGAHLTNDTFVELALALSWLNLSRRCDVSTNLLTGLSGRDKR